MKIAIIIPAYNEQMYLGKTLDSLIGQTYPASQILVVDDNSTDATATVVHDFSLRAPYVNVVHHHSSAEHAPGSKVVKAFSFGLEHLKTDYDLLCKFDADLIFPLNYLEKMVKIFGKNPRVGMAGGFCHIYKDGAWVLENLTNKDHLRGALKCYRKTCFEAIGGLKSAMGWDTIDELLAQYHGWQIVTREDLPVKHLKPTGLTYSKKAKLKQGQAFYGMRYGLVLTSIASAKLGVRKRSFTYFIDCLRGYLMAQKENRKYLVLPEEGRFIRNLRWKGIKKKIF